MVGDRNTMMLKVENLNKPSNKKWKLIADIMLYSLPLLNGIIVTMPLEDVWQKWIMFGVNIAIVAFKTVSKFTSEQITEE